MNSTHTHHVALLGFNQVQLLDLIGPLEAFNVANEVTGQKVYKTNIISEYESFISDSHVRVLSDHLLSAKLLDEVRIDTLLIPGGSGTRLASTKAPITNWLRNHFDQINRVVTVCTGAFIMGDLPYLANKEVVTHWAFANQLQKTYPQLKVNHERLFIRQGKFYSSAGILSGIDLALNLIERDCGVNTAASVAKYLVTYLKRAGHQSQFSEPLKFQSVNNTHLERMHGWLMNNLSKNISVSELATQSFISSRQLNRLIKKHFNMSASKYIEHIKLEHSKIYLSKENVTIDAVSDRIGFDSAVSFRRSFKRKYGIAPSSYQMRFH